jgi:trimeric autotransporter adhesin
MEEASNAVLALKPVTFRYKEEVDPDRGLQFGLVAEEVERVNPDLVVHDEQGKPFTVRYDAVNAMLLNEFLKERRKVLTLEDRLDKQQKQIEALTTAVRKVSERVELTATASQIAANDK